MFRFISGLILMSSRPSRALEIRTRDGHFVVLFGVLE